MLRYLSNPLFKGTVKNRSTVAVAKPVGDYVPTDTNTRNWLARLG